MSFANQLDRLGSFDASDISESQEFQQDAVNDTVSAKLEKGEIVINKKIYEDPDMQPVLEALFAKMIEKGQNPLSTIAGMPDLADDMGGQYDPMAVGQVGSDGNPQQFFFKSIWKAIKKIAKNPIVRTAITIGATAIGGPAVGAAVSGTMTKAAGGSWGQALGSAAGTYIGSSIGGGTTAAGAKPSFGAMGSTTTAAGLSTGTANTIGSQLASSASGSGMFSGLSGALQTGISSLPSSIGTAIGSANVGSMIGSNVGGMVGTMAGGYIDPPAIPDSMMINSGGRNLNPNSSIPTYASNLNLGLGAQAANSLYANSNLGPVNQMGYYGGGPSGAPMMYGDTGGGGFSKGLPSGVSYVRSLLDRQGNKQDVNVGTFGSSVDRDDRRFSLSAFGNNASGQGVLYY